MSSSINISSLKTVYVGFTDMGIHNLLWGILELGADCRVYDIAHCTSDFPEDYDNLKAFIKEAPTDIVFSQNFSPTVSRVCNELSIPYAAWTYDMPLTSLHHASIFNPCNYIFSFDKIQADYLKKKGVANVYHLPLAANISRSALINISAEDEAQFSCDISFVGNVRHKGWNDNYNEYKMLFSESDSATLSEIEDSTFGIWDGQNKIHELFTNELFNAFKKIQIKNPEIDERLYYETIISYHISELERAQMLKILLPFGIHHYSQSEYNGVEGLKSMPSLSYENELPKVYFLSKINMSSTLRSIPSGIPLRVFDILGLCSFCLTNYQPEIDEFFEIGKEIIVYHSLNEIPELVKYYLEHEEERMRIAANGFKHISDSYTWSKGIEKIIRTVIR